MAADECYVDEVETLARKGADIDINDAFGVRDYILCASSLWSNLEVSQFLSLKDFLTYFPLSVDSTACGSWKRLCRHSGMPC